MTCKDYRKQIELFDNNKMDYDSMNEFVRHVSQCDDCKEEFEIYYLIKYALADDDEKLDNIINAQPKAVRQYIQSLDFKGLVKYKLKMAEIRLDIIARNEHYQKCLFAIAEFSVILMAVFYLLGNIFV